jgi:hypothetical protein
MGAVDGDGLTDSDGGTETGLVRRAGCVGGLMRLVGAWTSGRVVGGAVVVRGLVRNVLVPRLGRVGKEDVTVGGAGC